ncbi:unnamed protein product [Scytosiphon promiscuus]
MSATDREALLLLRESTGGDDWDRSDKWGTDTDINQWHGVNAEAGRLRELQRGANNLRGRIPEELGRCSMLWMVCLSDNKLEGELPRSFGGLRHLTHLLLNGNKGLRGPIMEILVQLTTLREVTVADCSFEGTLPAGLGRLVNMERLSLSNNKFSGEIPMEMTKMGKLREFKLGGTDLTLPPNAWNQRNDFYLWMKTRGLVKYMKEIFPPFKIVAPAVAPAAPGIASPFPEKGEQGVLLEGPVSDPKQDCLDFGDYADVLVRRLCNSAAWPVGVGIYAQWGAGKSSLVELMIQGLEKRGSRAKSQESCLCRCLWMSTMGAVVSALWAGLVSVLRCSCCRKPEPPQMTPDAEDGRGLKDVTSVVARFDAWLYADSNVLWAVLISEIFKQVESHPCFGTGAVRATRVRDAIASSTFMEWCFVAITALVIAGIGVAAGLAAEEIAGLEQHLQQSVAGIALAGVPIAILLWIVKMLPTVFVGQGQLILSKAETMGESVGAARLGFMAEVQKEMQVLLGMLEEKSCKDKEHDYLLVVCIDNLDRCPHREIVKVLEAVHLLLEHNKVNVAVILALDPRVVIAAIEQDMGEGMRREVSGTEYLDKIIHWPFCIPFGTETERLDLLHSWLEPKRSGIVSATGTLQTSVRQPLGVLAAGSAGGDESSLEGSSSPAGAPRPSGASTTAEATSTASGGEHKEGESPASASGPLQASGRRPSPSCKGGVRQGLARQSSSHLHTAEEIEELETMIKAITTTPRKAKRLLNIYGIQRELATEREKKRKLAKNNNGSDDNAVFSRIDAKKLLRWTILSEFWPFHTACLLAVIRGRPGELKLVDVFNAAGTEFIDGVLSGTLSTDRTAESTPDSTSFSRAAAGRRLMGMDEADDGFLRVLRSDPPLLIEDFHEDKLGLLRLSFNLNPAMVATVTAWQRAQW